MLVGPTEEPQERRHLGRPASSQVASRAAFSCCSGARGLSIENQVPCLIRFNIVGKGWHGCTVEAGHENLVQIPIRRAAHLGRAPSVKLKAAMGRRGRRLEWLRKDHWLFLPRRGTFQHCTSANTSRPAFDPLCRDFGLRGDLDWCSGFSLTQRGEKSV